MSKLENSNALTLCSGFTPWATTTVQSTPRYTAPTEARPPGQSSRLWEDLGVYFEVHKTAAIYDIMIHCCQEHK